jgi:acetylornithine deacetylase/succinyl-diaminopimelate desuccinylase-like protein
MQTDNQQLASVFEHIDAHFAEHLELARTFVRQPSISATGVGVNEMAELVAESLGQLGAVTEVFATEGHPIVFGSIDVGAPFTLLIYGMYDVQPVEGEDWDVPPFDGAIRHVEYLGDCVVSRGIKNSKGPLAGTLSAIASLQNVNGELPLNLKFVVEGEEELGSPNLPKLLAKETERATANHVFYPFYAQAPDGTVQMELGVKGLVFMDLTVRGGDWGGPRSRNVHGAYGAWFHNPTWVLIQALSGLLSRDQKQIIPTAFYDAVAAPSEEDRTHLAALASTFDPNVHLQQQDVARFKFAATPDELLRHYLLEPSVNIDAFAAGHYGEGGKTLLPYEAHAQIDVRLVPNMEPARVIEDVNAFLREGGFEQVEVSVRSAYPWSKGSISDLGNSVVRDTYRYFGREPQVWPLSPGSAPFYAFNRILGLPVARGGLGHGGRQHAPNEYATVAGMKQFEKFVAAFLVTIAKRAAEDA